MRRRRFLHSAFAAAAVSAIPREKRSDGLHRTWSQVPPDVDALTGSGREVTLRGRDVADLASRLRGRLLLAGDPGYDEARRVLVPTWDKRPALVLQASGAADIATAVDFARDNGSLLLAVKCGGHSMSGKSTCDRGMLIDLSTFRHVRVDPRARTARVSGGSLLGAVDHETAAHGLVTTMGTVSHTGVGGLVTGGGFGRVGRRFGLAIDNLLSADVVTADGQLLHASEERNPDLFWGVRGGGGNFGIVTSLELRLHPMRRQVMGGAVMFPIERARNVLRVLAEYGPEAPDELDLLLLMIRPPEGGSIPTPVTPGRFPAPMVGFGVCWSGAPEELDRALAPLRAVGNPVVDAVEPIDYVALQRSGDVEDPRARASYLKSGFVPAIPEALIEILAEGLEGHPSRSTVLGFQQGGGAIGRVANEATAFPHREADGNLILGVDWAFGADPDEHVEWTRRLWSRIEPFTQGFYNHDGDPDAETVDFVANYRANYERLVEVKTRYDPANLFRLNANVEPIG